MRIIRGNNNAVGGSHGSYKQRGAGQAAIVWLRDITRSWMGLITHPASDCTWPLRHVQLLRAAGAAAQSGINSRRHLEIYTNQTIVGKYPIFTSVN